MKFMDYSEHKFLKFEILPRSILEKYKNCHSVLSISRMRFNWIPPECMTIAYASRKVSETRLMITHLDECLNTV
jgi:hypothetical protein